MRITWHGTASVLIEADETSLLFDPFLKDLPAGAEPREISDRRKTAFREQANVFITHGHLDHLAHVNDIYANTSATIFAPETAKSTLVREGFPEKRIVTVRPGGIFEFPGATGADALILPHQGRSDIDAHNRKVVEALRPKRVLLDHYDDAFPPISSQVPTQAFCEAMSRIMPTQALIEGEPVNLADNA